MWLTWVLSAKHGSSVIIVEHVCRERSLEFIAVDIFWRLFLRFLFLFFLYRFTLFVEVGRGSQYIVETLLVLFFSFQLVTSTVNGILFYNR